MVNDREFRTGQPEVNACSPAAPWHPMSGAPLDDIRGIADEEDEDEEEDEDDEDDEDLDEDLDEDEIEVEEEEENEPE
jgi:hypothetical protein